LRKRRPWPCETELPELTVEERRRPKVMSAAADSAAAGAADSAWSLVGYEAEVVGARVRKPVSGRSTAKDIVILRG